MIFYLTHLHPISFEKERGDMKMFFTIVPLSNSVREGELKGVSEKREGEMINVSVRWKNKRKK
jgi:hypothetical protein